MRITATGPSPIAFERAAAPSPATAGAGTAEPQDVAVLGASPAAQEALKLPILDPVFQLGMAMGVLSAMMGGAGGTSPEVAIRLISRTAAEETHAEYRLDLDNPDRPLVGSGTIGGKPLNERAQMEQGRMQWQGSLGDSRVNLHLAIDEQRESMTMKGTAGTAEADLTLGLLAGQENAFEGLRTSGRVDGQPYAVDTLIKGAEGLRAGGDPSVLQVRGHVNGEVIHRDYLVTVEKSANGYSLHATGGGFTGETLQDLEIQVEVSDRK